MILQNSYMTRWITGHEHADGLGIIHMNGRIYDPKLGRFLQADPFVQDAKNSQSLNRYTYVYNNPLSYTDPSGYFSLKSLWKKIRPFAAIALSIYMPQFGALWQTLGVANTIAIGAITAGVAAFVASGSISGALAGAFAGAAFGALHGWSPGSTLARAGKALSHGAVGGLQNVIQGARFGHGFLSAGFAQSLSGPISALREVELRVIAAAVAGGTISAVTGGKFGNGAVTGAFSRALNEEADARKQREREKARAEGEARVGPYLSGYDSSDPNYHRYTIGPTDLCTIGEMGCSFSLVAPITGSESVPFTLWYSGEGGYGLPYGLGWDPIIHRNPESDIWINVTEPGHRFHPGSVVHALYQSGGKLWLYTAGAGVGPNASLNIRIGVPLFGGMHLNVRAGVIHQQLGADPSITPSQ